MKYKPPNESMIIPEGENEGEEYGPEEEPGIQQRLIIDPISEIDVDLE